MSRPLKPTATHRTNDRSARKREGLRTSSTLDARQREQQDLQAKRRIGIQLQSLRREQGHAGQQHDRETAPRDRQQGTAYAGDRFLAQDQAQHPQVDGGRN